MSLVAKLEADTIAARKGRAEDLVNYNLMTTLFGEVAKEAKDDGNRAVVDADVTKLVTKFIKGAKEMDKYGNAEQKSTAVREIEILTGYLPKQLTDQELDSIMRAVVVETGKADLGTVMKHLKANHPGLYDGAQAKAVFNSLVTFEP